MRKGTSTNFMKEIWAAYARKLLLANPTLRGKFENKIPNSKIYKGNTVVLTYKVFRETMDVFFNLAKERICQGDTLVFKRSLGSIRARRVERNHANPTVNWARTMAQEKVWNEEKQKFVAAKRIFYTGDDWFRIGWHKPKYPSKEMVVYEFRPTKALKNGKGFDQMLTKALRENPYLKYQFIYYPLKRKANVT